MIEIELVNVAGEVLVPKSHGLNGLGILGAVLTELLDQVSLLRVRVEVRICL